MQVILEKIIQIFGTKKVINRYCKFNGIIPEKDIEQRSDHLFGYNDPINDPNKERSNQINSSSNTSNSKIFKSKKKISSILTNTLRKRKNSDTFNIFAKKNPRKTHTYKPFQTGIFLKKTRKDSLIDSKNRVKVMF